MADLLKGVAAGGWAFWVSWVFPSAITLGLIRVTLVPSVKSNLLGSIIAFDVTEELLVITLSAVGLGFVMSALSTPMYRILEGYRWPRFARSWGIRRQLHRKRRLQEGAESSKGLEHALIYEKLKRFPVDEGEVAPTRFGNAIRAFETYGVDRFRLDSQTWWGELITVVPEALRKENEESRASVDFAVAFTYLSLIYGVLSLVTAELSNGGAEQVAGAGIAASLAILWYQVAVISTSQWAIAINAIVNLGRGPLAMSLGLRMPATIEEERDMWEAVSAFTFYGFDPSWASKVDRYRDTQKG